MEQRSVLDKKSGFVFIIPKYLIGSDDWEPFVRKAFMEHVKDKKVLMITHVRDPHDKDNIQLGYELENQSISKVGSEYYLINVLANMDEKIIDDLVISEEFRLGYCLLIHDYIGPEPFVIGEAVNYYKKFNFEDPRSFELGHMIFMSEDDDFLIMTELPPWHPDRKKDQKNNSK